MNGNPIALERISESTRAGVHRLEAVVDGAPLWFTSTDAKLHSRPEGWATLLLIPSLHQGRRLQVPGPVSLRWASQCEALLEIFGRWWNYPRLKPSMTSDTAGLAGLVVGSDRTGLCFTGGVDSFFTLLRFSEPIHALIYLLPSEPAQVPSLFEAHLRRIAAARGLEAVVVCSNLRRHPIYAEPSWERTHGAALAAVGHFLAGSIGKLVVSSSYPYVCSRPWGSHYELDPLWSADDLEVVHFGATHWRSEKLIEIAGEPLVHGSLNPCWHDAGRLNCSRCEKCLRTQLVLFTCGKLERFTVFDRQHSLAEQADAVRRISNPGLFCVYEGVLQTDLPPALRSGLERLLARSRRYLFFRRCKDALRRLAGISRRSWEAA